MQDGVPKALMHFMVNALQRGLQQHLIRKLYREARRGCCCLGVLAACMGRQSDVGGRSRSASHSPRTLLVCPLLLCLQQELFEAIMEERQDIAAKRSQCQEVR